MAQSKNPRLRTATKIPAPYPLNQFPPDFGLKLGKEIIYLLATKSIPDIAGSEWEQVFANCIGAVWKPSNIGLDDIVLGNCAWSAKSIKSANPIHQKTVRLISGRNSPTYSFDQTNLDVDPQIIGEQVLEIWNSRVEFLRSKYAHLRTVVLIKSNDLTLLVTFEFETVRYPIDKFIWKKNQNGNLEGYSREEMQHRFTWQPHGSQFTIIEPVPNDCLVVSIRKPQRLGKETVLSALNFDESWIKVTRRQELTPE